MTRPLRVAILISGSGSNMVALVDSMQQDHPARPVLVVSNVPDAPGLAKAAARNVPTAVVDHRAFGGDRAAFESDLTRELSAADPDIICLAGWMRILSPSFIDAWAGRILNIHPSLLPKYKGLNTHARALDAGDTMFGATVHKVTAELDGGPILGQTHLAIVPGDTPTRMQDRLRPLEHALYVDILRRVAAELRLHADFD